jgi:hypothetical protein
MMPYSILSGVKKNKAAQDNDPIRANARMKAFLFPL